MKWYIDGVIIRCVGLELTENGAEVMLTIGRQLHGKALAEIILTRREREDGAEWIETEYILRRGLSARIKEKVRNLKCFTTKRN